MFNKLKSLFGGSNEAEFDPLNIRLFDLNVGSVVDYKTSTYLVEEEYVYDWGDEDFSKELLLSNGSEKFWLSIEDEKSTSLFIHEKIRLRELGTDLPEEMELNDTPPKQIHYRGQQFLREEESPGYCKQTNASGSSEWIEFIAWDYLNADQNEQITIEQWDENEFEASIGKRANANDFRNLIPAK